MSDFKITNLINGGARIHEYNPGLVERPLLRSFEITEDQFNRIKTILAETRESQGKGEHGNIN